MTKWFGLLAGVVLSALFFMTPAASLAQAQPTGGRVIPEYHLGAGDKVRIITYGEESLSGEFFVSGSGKIAVPLVGELPATGLTAREFAASVESALRDGDLLKEPKVSIEVLNYRPFYILGEVEKPGTYPYTSDLNVMNAVATAGGFTYRANQKKVFIKRQDSDKEEEFSLDPTTKVAPGDTIRIAERLF